MLPIKPLDDQMFEDIVMRARRMISRLTPEWTDENLHDPGITMVELLAFMKEMQQYHMDRVPARNVEKFLKLLGSSASPARPARATVWVRRCPASFDLAQGTPFIAGDVVFETQRDETLVTAEVSSLITRSGGEISVSMEVADVHEAFGAAPEAGDELFICLSGPLPQGREINLSVTVARPRYGERNPLGEDFIPLSEIEFDYSAGGGWKPLRIVSEGTGGFLQTGVIRFALPEAMSPASDGPAIGQNAIRCRLVRSEFDEIPRLELVQINALPIEQRRTLAHTLDIACEEGGPAEYPIRHHLALSGSVDVFLREGEGFRRVYGHDTGRADAAYAVLREGATARLALDAPTDARALRIVLTGGGFDAQLLHEGDGLPGQRAELSGDGLLLPDVMLMEMDGRGIYHDYRFVENFDASLPEDRHFRWDAAEGRIVFGDGRNGRAPSGLLFVVRHARTLGAAGNVRAGEIRSFAPWAQPGALHDCLPENIAHVSGGADARSLEEALSILRRDMAQPACAVTLADYESIARRTPGLVVRRACALPMPPPGVASVAGMNAVTLVVETGDAGRALSAAQKENLLRHLNRSRLVTTRVYVIPPEYIAIQVHCDVRVRTQHLDPEAIIQQALEDYFSVEWPFGRSVQYADIYGLLDTLECVSAVQALTIGAQGRGVRINASGDVILPPQGLVALEPCVVRATTR